MPMLNIGGVSGNNETLSLGICFLSSEREGDYKWVMEAVLDMMVTHSIKVPLTIITDRELALLNALEATFSSSRHLLCQWHISMNVLAKTRRFFPAASRGIPGSMPVRHPSFEAFLKEWANLLLSNTLDQFNTRLATFQVKGHPNEAVLYAVKTWIPWKEKIVSFWVDQYPHFGNTTTSRLEGLHAVMKQYIRASTGDLKGVFHRLQLFWRNQDLNLKHRLADQRNRRPQFVSNELYNYLRDSIHDTAIAAINAELVKIPKDLVSPPKTECSGYHRRAFGIPCQHEIWEAIQARKALRTEQVHHFWWLYSPNAGTFAARPAPIAREPPQAITGGRKKVSVRRRQAGWGQNAESSKLAVLL